MREWFSANIKRVVYAVNIEEYFVLGCGFILAGLFVEEHFHIVGLFVSEVGIAMVVAAIIGFCIEEKHKRKIERLADDNVGKIQRMTLLALFGWEAPTAYLDLLLKHIFGKDFIREDIYIEYEIEEVCGNVEVPSRYSCGEYVKLTTKIKQVLTNPKKIACSYKFNFGTEEDEIVSAFCSAPGVFINKSRDEVIQCIESVDKIGDKEYGFGSVDLNPGETLNSEIVMIGYRPKIYCRETFTTRYYTKNVRIVLRVPSDAYMAECTNSFMSSMRKHESNGAHLWTNTVPFVPAGTVNVRWHNHNAVKNQS